MIKQANIKMPLACWEAIKGTYEECDVLDDGTIEHTVMYPFGFFDDENNPMEWIAARVRISEDGAREINKGYANPGLIFAENYDTDLIEITFEV